MRHFALIIGTVLLFFRCSPGRQELWVLDSGVSVVIKQNTEGDWGISLIQNGNTFLEALYPLHVELSNGINVVGRHNNGFKEYSIENDVLHAQGTNP